MVDRMHQANVAKSMINSIMLDKEEEWDRVTASFGGLTRHSVGLLQVVSGAVDIPATRFLGMSPAGLNATGESDIRNYYDKIKADQENKLQPALAILDEVIIRSTFGTRDPDICDTGRSFWPRRRPRRRRMARAEGRGSRGVSVASGPKSVPT